MDKKYNLDKITNSTEMATAMTKMTNEFVNWFDYHDCWTPLHSLEREFAETFGIDQNVVHLLVTGLIRSSRDKEKMSSNKQKAYTVKMPGRAKEEYSLDEIEGWYINFSDGKSGIICCLIDEIRRIKKLERRSDNEEQ